MERVEHLEQAGTYWNKLEQKIFISTLIFNIVPDVPPVLYQNKGWVSGEIIFFSVGTGVGLPGHEKAPGDPGLSILCGNQMA